MQKLAALVARYNRVLTDAGADTPALDARVLIKSVTGLTDADFITGDAAPITDGQAGEIASRIARRAAGEPVSKIIGQKEFWGLEFEVTADTLSPRPDTETLVAAALAWARGRAEHTLHILDLGTGTGCILIALLRELGHATGVAVDLSPSALDVARRNAARHGVSTRFTGVESDWIKNVKGTFDLIVSNPPYIPNPDMESLPIEVRNHDPILALRGGADGFDSYREIITAIKPALKPGGRAFLEIGFGQDEKMMRLVDDSALRMVGIWPDIAGIPRVVEISHGEK